MTYFDNFGSAAHKSATFCYECQQNAQKYRFFPLGEGINQWALCKKLENQSAFVLGAGFIVSQEMCWF